MTVTDIAPYLGEKQPFNPNEHIMKLKSKEGAKDYLPVQWRLVWFREQCPNGTIDTEEIVVDLDRECEAEVYTWNQDTKRSEKIVKRAPGYARYRAIVTDGKGGRATGTKTERGVDFPDFVEKAETGAIGRALAALGYGTQFAPELDEQERIVDAPTTVTEQKSTRPYNERRPFVEADKPKDQALHELAKPQPYQETQANGHHDLPTLRELQARCKALFGAGKWQAVILKALKVEDPDLTIQEDDLTPDDRERIAAYMDFAENKKASAGAGK